MKIRSAWFLSFIPSSLSVLSDVVDQVDPPGVKAGRNLGISTHAASTLALLACTQWSYASRSALPSYRYGLETTFISDSGVIEDHIICFPRVAYLRISTCCTIVTSYRG